ncbi:MAG: hypothetical protein ABIR32_05305, partial [Ilumatobacteraceae bacterium]
MATRDEALAQLTGPGGPFEIGPAVVGGEELRVYINAAPSLRSIWTASETNGDAAFLVFQD